MNLIQIALIGGIVGIVGIVLWTRSPNNTFINKRISWKTGLWYHTLHLSKEPENEEQLKKAYVAWHKRIPKDGIQGWWWHPRLLVLQQAYKTGKTYLMAERDKLENTLEHIKQQSKNINWKKVLELDKEVENFMDVKTQYIRLTKKYHPDSGSEPNNQKMIEIQQALKEAEKYFKK